MGVTSAIRSLTLNLVFFVGLVLSHHLGGGSFSYSPFLIPIFAFSFFIFWTKPVKVIRGPFLALLLVLVQVIGHFDLAMSAPISALRMSFSHVIGIAVSYFLAVNFDQAIMSLVTILRSFFEPVALMIFNRVSITLTVPRTRRECYNSAEHFGSVRRRGPPFLAISRA